MKKAIISNFLQQGLWGVKYHKIFFGKISYDILIDDKCFFFRKDWNKKIFENFKLLY